MYPINWRTLAIRVYQKLGSLRKAAIVLNVHYSTLSRWVSKPKKQYARKEIPKSDLIVSTVRDALVADPFLTVRKLQAVVLQVFKFTVSKELIRTAISKASFTLKKAKRFSQPSDLMTKTQAFLQHRKDLLDQGYQFFSLDETSFGRHGLLSHGYAPRGKPLLLKNRAARVTTTSSMALASPCKLEKITTRQGSFDTSTFLEFLKDVSLPAKSVVLLDNVRFHHAVKVKELMDAKGVRLLFVPPYSPWFNPIEGIFSIVKRHYYVHSHIQDAFRSVTARHCAAFFQKALATTEMV